MSDWGWILAGGAALTGFLSVSWGYIKSLWNQLAGRVIVTTDLRGRLAEAVGMYFWKNFNASRFGLRTYVGQFLYVRPAKRVQMITLESIGLTSRLYWKGWRPIWIARTTSEKNTVSIGGTYYNGGIRLTFLRGTFDIDKLLIDATTQFNHLQAATDNEEQTRYRVVHFFGTANKPVSIGSEDHASGSSASPVCSDGDPLDAMQHRILQWHPNELGTNRINHGNALAQQALNTAARVLVDEVRHWKHSEDWYKARGIPWRRGWLLYGPPGTGKTALTRAVAEDFDLPIFAFDLATLFNNELQGAWQKMLEHVPCIALFEDIDSVFDGRENKVGGHLTYDCFLNCLDGIEQADGVLLVITTNRLEKLDPALGIPSAQVSTRPGRLDRVLELTAPDAAGRLQLCQRILHEWPETWDETVQLGAGETGAQFQERCTQLALDKYWETR